MRRSEDLVAVDETMPTRERILDASAGLFRRQGAAATGLKEIVRESRAPWGSLYHYFPDGKEQLIAESLLRTGERYARLMERAFAGADPPSAGVLRYFNAAADNLARSDFADGCPVGTVALEAANASERIRLVCADVFATWQQVVADALSGSGIPRERALDLATQFLVSLEGALILSRAQRDEAVMRRAGEMVAAAVDAECSRRPGRSRRVASRARQGT
ncbi:MAG TPA: TetR/AcrR family transcriptional regulator [Acidimicrobiia bacterium]|nr:TetR/AcrR family transcriptional regulator [Acidimicrobiia bacterium]HKN90998.1 TetR/AcrR family transcriptional regulator [Acidimicrobiia bacterium]